MGKVKADFYSVFSDTFKLWAEDMEDIRAAFIIGSRARSDHPADVWSDLDILLFTENPEFYLTQSHWLDDLGKVVCTFSTLTAGGDPERLILFEGGYQVDFVVAHTDELNRLVNAKKIHGNFYRGVKVLVDKDAVSHLIMPEKMQIPRINRVSPERFAETCQMFWFVALYVAKQIKRGELWVAKSRDHDLKQLLLQMAEWYETCIHGNDYDTWHAGRFLSEWMNPDFYSKLQQCFGRFEAADTWRALMETVSLFKQLSHEVAGHMGYPCVEAEYFIEQWLALHEDGHADKI